MYDILSYKVEKTSPTRNMLIYFGVFFNIKPGNTTCFEINFLQGNQLLSCNNLVNDIAQDKWNDTNVLGTELNSVKLGSKGIITLTQDDQDGENTRKETTEGIGHCCVRKLSYTSALTDIGTTETNMNTTNTSPADEA